MSSANSTLNKFTPSKPGNKRQATWLEVFFDLVFAVAVTQLASYLNNHSDMMGFVRYSILFIPVWWAWVGFSYFSDLFDADRKTYFRVILLMAMLVVLAMALNTRDALTATSFNFAACYTLLQILLISLYVWACKDVEKTKQLCHYFMVGFCGGAVFWLLSLFVSPPTRFVLWGLGLTVEIATPLVAYLSVNRKPVHGSHMPYRLGQFTMIVIGETVAAVAVGVADTQWQLPTIFAAVNGFAIAICFWWLYFSHMDRTSIDRALRSDTKELLKSFVYGYGHIAIFAGIAAVGVGIELAIETASKTNTPIPLFYGAAIALVGLTAVHLVSAYFLPLWAVELRLVTAMLAVILAQFNLEPAIAISCFVLSLLTTVFLEEHYLLTEET